MSEPTNQRFTQLLNSLTLREITPTELQSQRLGNLPPAGSELRLEWNQALANGDPLAASPESRVFRPKYEFFVRCGEETLFRQRSIFILSFSVTDAGVFNALWADEELRKVFVEKQLQRTMWPIFRQHVLDGMSRLAMPPVPLPWLM